jgi:hypothetical protein
MFYDRSIIIDLSLCNHVGQNPLKSRNLKVHISSKLGRSRTPKAKFEILCRMLNTDPWKHHPLKLHILNPDIELDKVIRACGPLPVHMKVTTGTFDSLDTYHPSNGITLDEAGDDDNEECDNDDDDDILIVDPETGDVPTTSSSHCKSTAAAITGSTKITYRSTNISSFDHGDQSYCGLCLKHMIEIGNHWCD